jgi:hypothetical protein
VAFAGGAATEATVDHNLAIRVQRTMELLEPVADVVFQKPSNRPD